MFDNMSIQDINVICNELVLRWSMSLIPCVGLD